VQTEWATGWSAATAGFGYTAEFVTKHADQLGSLIDQAGLAVFFLQRHRVELVMKNLLGVAGATIRNTHSLSRLWDDCREALESLDPETCQSFARDHEELIEALSKADDNAEAFRFPVDTKGNEIARPAFVDLRALNTHVEDFYYGRVATWTRSPKTGRCARITKPRSPRPTGPRWPSTSRRWRESSQPGHLCYERSAVWAALCLSPPAESSPYSTCSTGAQPASRRRIRRRRRRPRSAGSPLSERRAGRGRSQVAGSKPAAPIVHGGRRGWFPQAGRVAARWGSSQSSS
jgi:hypothetical protein